MSPVAPQAFTSSNAPCAAFAAAGMKKDYGQSHHIVNEAGLAAARSEGGLHRTHRHARGRHRGVPRCADARCHRARRRLRPRQPSFAPPRRTRSIPHYRAVDPGRRDLQFVEPAAAYRAAAVARDLLVPYADRRRRAWLGGCEPRHAAEELAAGDGTAGAAARVGLHRRLRAGRVRVVGRAWRDHPLGPLGALFRALSGRARRRGRADRARRQDLLVGGSHGGHRPGVEPGGRGLWPRTRAGDRAGVGGVSRPGSRAGPAQHGLGGVWRRLGQVAPRHRFHPGPPGGGSDRRAGRRTRVPERAAVVADLQGNARAFPAAVHPRRPGRSCQGPAIGHRSIAGQDRAALRLFGRQQMARAFERRLGVTPMAVRGDMAHPSA